MNDEAFDQEIAKREAKVRDLAQVNEAARLEFEARERKFARYFRLLEEEKRLECEIAAMEGRPYYDEDGPYCQDCPEPPEEMDAWLANRQAVDTRDKSIKCAI